MEPVRREETWKNHSPVRPDRRRMPANASECQRMPANATQKGPRMPGECHPKTSISMALRNVFFGSGGVLGVREASVLSRGPRQALLSNRTQISPPSDSDGGEIGYDLLLGPLGHCGFFFFGGVSETFPREAWNTSSSLLQVRQQTTRSSV